MGWGDEDKVVDAGAPVAPSAVSWGGNDKAVNGGLSLRVDPRPSAGLPVQRIGLGGDVTPASVTPVADAAGEGLLGSLATSASVLPLAAGGANELLHMPETRDSNFGLATTLRNLGDRMNADAASRSATGATAGNVAAILPQLLASPLLASQIVSGGTQPALHALDKGADVGTAEKLLGLGTSMNAAANLLPIGIGGNVVARTLTGGGINAGAGYAIPAIEHAVAPAYTEAPTLQDAITQGGIGAILAAALGRGPAPRIAGEPRMEADPVPMGLPRGADFTGDARTVRPGEQPVGPNGTVAVTPAGEAFTPAQGKAQVADVLQNALRAVPDALPAPVVNVDSAGTAMATADQNAKAIQAQNVAQSPIDATQQKRDLGITPDIERTQAVKWGQQDQQVKAEQSNQDAAASAPVVSGGLRAAKVLADGPAYPAEPYDMTPDQIATHSQAVEAHGRNVEDAILGDQADAWRKAYRQSNSSNDVRANAGLQKVSDIEAALPQSQIDKLYGVGETNDANDLLDDYKSIHEDVDLADTPQQASVVLSRLLPKLGGTEGRDPANWKRDQQVAYAGMRSLADKIQAEGWDSSEIQKRALSAAAARYGDMNDAEFMLQRFLKPRDSAATGVGQDKPAIGSDAKFSFAGERAQTADRGALAQAQQMEAVGRDSVPDREGNVPGSEADTHTATGWSRGKDGKWRFEIDDSQASIKPLAEWADNSKYPHRMPDVGQVLDHPELLKAYPQLADVGVRSDTDLGTSIGAYNPSRNVVEIRDPASYPPTGPKSLKSVLLHEIQHAIQNHEGFARGASVSEFKEPRTSERDQLNGRITAINKLLSESSSDGNKARYDQLLSERSKVVRQLDEKGLRNEVDIHEAAHKDYKRVSGETEARNTQTRMDLSAADRRATPPSETEDVPRSQQIVKFGREPSMDEGETHVTQQDRAATDKISQQLSDHIGKPVSLVPASELPHALRRGLDAFDSVVGGKTTVFENNTPHSADFQGVTMRDGQRFVNVTSDVPLLQVAVHEFGHDLRKDRPDLWKELGDHMEQNGDIDAYLAQLKKNAKAGGFDPESVSRGEAHDELVSDAMGDAMVDPEFLERLAKNNPTLFAKVAAYFKQALDRILSRLKDMGSNKYVRDVQAFRDKLEDVLTRYATERTGAPRAASGDDLAMSRRSEPDPQTQTKPADNRIAFSRKPVDGATTVEDAGKSAGEPDYLNDMPSRRPGESQTAYARRVMRKSRGELQAATALVKQQRQLGRYALRGMMATQARQAAIADATLNVARKSFDKTPDVINFASVNQWETGKHIDDADFRAFIEPMQAGFDQRIAEIRRLAPGALESLISNYMPHLYEDSGKATKWYQNVMGKKPLQGDKSFLKQREWPTLKEAMASGLKPISPNPVDWVLMKYHQMDKFIGLLRLKQDFADRGWLMKMEAGQRPPEGFSRVDDPSFQIAGGLQGYYVVPDMIAKDINNYLAPGLSRYGAWRSMRAVQNAMVSWNLGWSAFHAGFTSIDNAVTHGAAGLQKLVQGDIMGGLKDLALSVPTMITSPFEGGKLNRQWTGQAASDPNTAALLSLLEQGGARMKMGNVTAEYNNALPQLLRTIRRMQAPGHAADQLAAMKRRMAVEPAAELARTGWGAIKGIGHIISAVGETGSFLIHHVLVPNQKMAARVTLLKFELDSYAKKLGKEKGDYEGIISVMNPDVAKQLASDVVDKVDFRLGQMTYENFFYPKIAREIAQMLVMAPGWQAGAFQTMTGGIKDLGKMVKPEKLVAPLDKAGKITDAHRGRFTNNVANLAMLFLMVGGGNALYQWLVSGIEPDDAKDLVAPRTGRKNADDSDERIVLPSYMKDHYEFFHHPVAMASHKLHPAWRLMWEIGHNEDYFGNMIRDPHHPLAKQAKEMAGYLLKSMLPFTASNAAKVKENGGGAGQYAANFVGITPASASMARSKFQAFVAKGGEKGWDYPASTPAEAAYHDKQRKAETAIRTGKQPDLAGLADKDVRNLQKRVQTLKPELQFARLGLADKLDAYQLATPQERERYHLTDMLQKTHPQKSVSFRRLPEEEQAALLDKLDKAVNGDEP